MRPCSSYRGLRAGLFVALVLLLSPVVTAAAPLTLYTDRDAFLAAASPDRLLTFDEPTSCTFELIPGETPLGPTTFPQCRFDFGDIQVLSFEPNFPGPRDGVVPAEFTGMAFILPANTYAVGIDFLQAARTSFEVSFGGGLLQWTHAYSPPECNIFQGTPPCEPFSGFVGVISADDTVSIPRFAVRGSPPGFLLPPLSSLPYPAVVDNLVWRVPEPTTALLLGIGLVGVCWRGRHTKRRLRQRST